MWDQVGEPLIFLSKLKCHQDAYISPISASLSATLVHPISPKSAALVGGNMVLISALNSLGLEMVLLML